VSPSRRRAIPSCGPQLAGALYRTFGPRRTLRSSTLQRRQDPVSLRSRDERSSTDRGSSPVKLDERSSPVQSSPVKLDERSRLALLAGRTAGRTVKLDERSSLINDQAERTVRRDLLTKLYDGDAGTAGYGQNPGTSA